MTPALAPAKRRTEGAIGSPTTKVWPMGPVMYAAMEKRVGPVRRAATQRNTCRAEHCPRQRQLGHRLGASRGGR